MLQEANLTPLPQAGRPALDWQLGVDDAELANQSATGLGVCQGGRSLDQILSPLLPLLLLLGQLLLGLALLDAVYGPGCR